jgi:hypothetical protein
MVAPVTSTIHGVPSEVLIGLEHSLKNDSAVDLDHVQTVDRSRLTRFLGHLDDRAMAVVCDALAIATGCDWLTRTSHLLSPPAEKARLASAPHRPRDETS